MRSKLLRKAFDGGCLDRLAVDGLEPVRSDLTLLRGMLDRLATILVRALTSYQLLAKGNHGRVL